MSEIEEKASEFNTALSQRNWTELKTKLTEEFRQNDFPQVVKHWQDLNSRAIAAAIAAGQPTDLPQLLLVADNKLQSQGCDQILVGDCDGVFELFETKEHRQLELNGQDSTRMANLFTLRQQFAYSVDSNAPIYKNGVLPWQKDSSPLQ